MNKPKPQNRCAGAVGRLRPGLSGGGRGEARRPARLGRHRAAARQEGLLPRRRLPRRLGPAHPRPHEQTGPSSGCLIFLILFHLQYSFYSTCFLTQYGTRFRLKIYEPLETWWNLFFLGETTFLGFHHIINNVRTRKEVKLLSIFYRGIVFLDRQQRKPL